ncbi:DUF309 domain-containing protein [Paenibacillus sp. sptzw28]|uniref:DUF309 domain-containing protein n=1 Tax=Paenibacillus sp. sptzw28 TaxID=715179 RepID=UPI001C6F349E|nr:DUF309 domain-containing protein [Paenibacillus sp. sptzw28]QYR23454.1 DUF309 domain-containing protein [Paenibacillus sp. sptzw28]
MPAGARYDEKFVHFVVLFNVDEDYFECHEVMEELWLEEGRNTLYQGLLQAAVGLHHWRNDNFSGAVKLFTQAENKLAHYPDEMMGLDLRQLRSDIARCLEPLSGWLKLAETGKSGESGEAGKTDGGGKPTEGPPAFAAFRLIVTDDELRALAKALADIPLEQRLHKED